MRFDKPFYSNKTYTCKSMQGFVIKMPIPQESAGQRLRILCIENTSNTGRYEGVLSNSKGEDDLETVVGTHVWGLGGGISYICKGGETLYLDFQKIDNRHNDWVSVIQFWLKTPAG
jgi:hypothetical protein